MELSDEDMLKVTLSDLPPEAVPNYKATVGQPLQDGIPHATKDDIIGALKAVQDPELFMNVYELGLIYDIRQEENGDVFILMTLTSPMCPIAGEMPMMVAEAVANVSGVGLVDVKLVWDPPWTLDRLSDEIKLILGI